MADSIDKAAGVKESSGKGERMRRDAGRAVVGPAAVSSPEKPDEAENASAERSFEEQENASAEKFSDGTENASDETASENPPQSEKQPQNKAARVRKPMRKEVKLAVGVSITVVLLALIITLVIIAVTTAGKISQLFATEFTDVGNEARGDYYIAQIDGEYVLMNGDRVAAGRYAALKWDGGLNGYLYLEEDGDAGVLNYDGKKRFTQQDGPSLWSAAAFTPTTATFGTGTASVTYRLADGEKIDALQGASCGYSDGDVWFVARQDRYVIFRLTGAAGATLTTDRGAVISADLTDAAGYTLAAASEGHYLLSNGTLGLALSGERIEAQGAYSSASVSVKGKSVRFASVDGVLFDGSAVRVEGATGGDLVSRENLLQTNAGVYAASADGTLTLLKGGARLAGEEKTFLLTDVALFDGAGKQLIASEHGTLTTAGDGAVLDGDVAREIGGDRSVGQVKSVLAAFADDAVFLLKDGSVASLDGQLISAAKLSEYGGLKTGEAGDVLRMRAGYLLALKTGSYSTPGDGTFFASVVGESVTLARLGGDDAENFAVLVVSSGRRSKIRTYRQTQNGVTPIADYFYADSRFLTDEDLYRCDEFGGVLFRTGEGKVGLLGANGKVSVKPQFGSLTLCNGFTVAADSPEGGGTFYAAADYQGKLQSPWTTAVSVLPLRDFVLFTKTNGGDTGILYGAQGKVVLRDILEARIMVSYELRNGVFVAMEDEAYVKLRTASGFRVLRVAKNASEKVEIAGI